MPVGLSAGTDRREQVRRILAAEPIHDQGELLRQLRRRGVRVTQSSVSRDLQELGAIKVDGRYVTREKLARGAPVRGGIEEAGRSIRRVRAAGPYLLVVLTPPGLASAVGLTVDGAGWPEVVGTVAGDDTVLIATSGRRDQARVEARLTQIMKRSVPPVTKGAARE